MMINLREWTPAVKVYSHLRTCPKRILGERGPYAADRFCVCKPPAAEVTDNSGQVIVRFDEDGATDVKR